MFSEFPRQRDKPLGLGFGNQIIESSRASGINRARPAGISLALEFPRQRDKPSKPVDYRRGY
ncbi:hypothetical protein G9407_05175 [Escherichia coli]|nr:hypothetical protein [Escherichia coli]NYZ26220.1 hypothetical protein [Escherichia coli]